MDFKKGSNIISSDGETVGSLKRVVLDPQSKKAGYLVIERGLLFTEDKLVPMDFVEKVTDEGVVLHEPKEALDKLNKFEVTEYIPLDSSGDDVEAYYWYPPLSGMNMGGGYPLFPQPAFIEHTESNIPENYVALKEGARVMSADDKEIGNITRIITDPANRRVTHLVISRGMLQEDKLVPAQWITDVSEDEVRLSIEARVAERLARFEA
jgi:uncharacterized protein YrrD